MKNVYIAVMVLTFAMAGGQYANANTINNVESQKILDQYYIDYCNVKDHEISKYRVENGVARIKFGDDNVGYYNTKEEYINMFDSSISAVN